MANPSSSLATLRPDLAGSFMEFELAADRQGFIGPSVLPVIEVAKPSGIFGKIELEQLLDNRETLRTPGAGYARSEWQFTKDSFATVEHGAEEPVDDAEATMYREFFDMEQISSMRAMDVVLRNMERRIADAVFNASTWTGSSLTTSVTTEWSAAASIPLTDVEAAVSKVWDGTGIWPNALIVSRKVFRNLRNVSQIIDRIKYSGLQDPNARGITREALANAFDLDMIIVGGAAKNTATEGQSASIGAIWSNEYAMVAKIATSSDVREPCIGRMFHWGEDGSDIGGTVETYRDESVRGDVIRVRHQVDEKILYAGAGHLLSNITA